MPFETPHIGLESHLAARMVPQILPVDLELGMIVHVHQLMHQRILHMTLAPETILTEQDPALWAESTGTSEVAWLTVDVVSGYVCTIRLQVLHHERHCWAL